MFPQSVLILLLQMTGKTSCAGWVVLPLGKQGSCLWRTTRLGCSHSRWFQAIFCVVSVVPSEECGSCAHLWWQSVVQSRDVVDWPVFVSSALYSRDHTLTHTEEEGGDLQPFIRPVAAIFISSPPPFVRSNVTSVTKSDVSLIQTEHQSRK